MFDSSAMRNVESQKAAKRPDMMGPLSAAVYSGTADVDTQRNLVIDKDDGLNNSEK